MVNIHQVGILKGLPPISIVASIWGDGPACPGRSQDTWCDTPRHLTLGWDRWGSERKKTCNMFNWSVQQWWFLVFLCGDSLLLYHLLKEWSSPQKFVDLISCYRLSRKRETLGLSALLASALWKNLWSTVLVSFLEKAFSHVVKIGLKKP